MKIQLSNNLCVMTIYVVFTKSLVRIFTFNRRKEYTKLTCFWWHLIHVTLIVRDHFLSYTVARSFLSLLLFQHLK